MRPPTEAAARVAGADWPSLLAALDERGYAVLPSVLDPVECRDIAAVLGQPRAVRAVAQACATNKLALLVPCHRVVRSDGELAGYRWGIERKRELIARERAAVPADAAAD